MRNIPLIRWRPGPFYLDFGIGPDWGKGKLSISVLDYDSVIKCFTILEICLWLPAFDIGFSW